MANLIKLDTRDFTQNITLIVDLKNLRQWRWRLILGCWLIRLAATIMWVNIEFLGAAYKDKPNA